MSASRELARQLLVLEPSEIYKFVSSNIKEFNDKNFWKNIIAEMKIHAKEQEKGASFPPMQRIEQCVAICRAVSIPFKVMEGQGEFCSMFGMEIDIEAEEVKKDFSSLFVHLQNAYPKEGALQSHSDSMEVNEADDVIVFEKPLELHASQTVEEVKNDKKDISALSDSLVIGAFNPALEYRTGFKRIGSKKSDLEQLKTKAENLKEFQDVENLAHEVEKKIAEWEGPSKSHKTLDDDTKKSSQLFKKKGGESKLKIDHSYIKYLSTANNLLTGSRKKLIEAEVAKLSTPEEKLRLINSKINNYKIEIRAILAAKGKAISVPKESKNTSILSRLFAGKEKMVYKYDVDEYFDNSPYAAHLMRLQKKLELELGSASQTQQSSKAISTDDEKKSSDLSGSQSSPIATPAPTTKLVTSSPPKLGSHDG